MNAKLKQLFLLGSTAFFCCGLNLVAQETESTNQTEDWKLVWSDEFDRNGEPDSTAWTHEEGFVRNKELQWYQSQNAICKDGLLVISGKKEQVKNHKFDLQSTDWQINRQFAQYTGSSIKTQGKKEFLYGRFEIRAKIPTAKGAWPAIWTLGNTMQWPSCGEVDLLELYLVNKEPHILANTAWGNNKPYNAVWNSNKIPLTYFLDKDPLWEDKFHVWRVDWDENAIKIYLDDELVNETLLSNTQNGAIGDFKNPFRQPHYILLNLAIGANGGIPDDSKFPLIYEIDYVRVYQKKSMPSTF